MKNLKITKLITSAGFAIFIFMVAEPTFSQSSLPIYFGFDSPPEFDPITMEAIPNLTGQNGLVEIINGNGAAGTSYCVRMTKSISDDVATQNALNLKVNLSEYAGKQLELSFYMTDNDDENQYYDGVFLSDGSGSFKRVFALDPDRWCTDKWGYFRLDLDDLIAKAGLNYTNDFIIQFRHEGSRDFASFYHDILYIDEVRINEANTVIPASVPYKQGFDSGLGFDSEWFFQEMEVNTDGELSNYKSPYEYTSKVNSNASDGDNYSLFLGKWDNCNGELQRNTADLHLDLNGLDNNDLELTFDFMNWQDETQFWDGVWLSDDGGLTFPQKPAIALEPASWQSDVYGSFHPFDLDELIRKQGLAFSSDFVIRFQHEDEASVSQFYKDGLFFDNIQVNILPQLVYKQVPFIDNFDQDDINLDHWRRGNTQLDNDGNIISASTPNNSCGLYPILGTGPKGWHLGKSDANNGKNFNYVDLHISANNYNPLTLSFDLYEFDEEFQTEDGIDLSVDGGVTFNPVYDFDWDSNVNRQWNTFQISLSDLSFAKNMVLSDKTIVRFQQVGYNGWGNFYPDGYIFKNINLSGVVSSKNSEIQKNHFSLYPNPTNETLYLDIYSNVSIIEAQYEIRNPIGELFISNQIESSKETIDVSKLPQGLYFIELKGEEGRISKQFIKIK